MRLKLDPDGNTSAARETPLLLFMSNVHSFSFPVMLVSIPSACVCTEDTAALVALVDPKTFLSP